MKNIPMFTTDAGVASLTLEEIPYKGCAYIRLQSATSPEKLLADAIGFCRAAGALDIYATGDDHLEVYPFHTEIWEMQCARCELRAENVELIQVDDSTVTQWQQLYNRYMANVPNATTMTASGAKNLLDTKDAYFVYSEGNCIGIGKARRNKIEVVISLIPGKGSDVLRALCGVLEDGTIKVEVVSTNTRAVKLYERHGFEKTRILAKWYKVV